MSSSAAKVVPHSGSKRDTNKFQAVRLFPDMLGLLRDDHSSEVKITVEDGNFLVIATIHKTCEEHGCKDEKCRLTVHDSSLELVMPGLDEVLTDSFAKAYTGESSWRLNLAV